MGFLDKAKKLAEQAMDKAQEAVAEVKERSAGVGATSTTSLSDAAPPPPGTPAGRATRPTDDTRPPLARGTGAGPGTAYVPGMLGRPGWRERELVDPAGVLPIRDRLAAGVPQSTKSQILEEPFGMGRRWSGAGRTAGLYYRLHPDHAAWQPPGGTHPLATVPGASHASLTDGRVLTFLPGPGGGVVVETAGVDDRSRAALVSAAAAQLASSN